MQQQLTQVNTDKQTELAQKQVEIQQKIDDGNRAVASKQSELNTANQTISSLRQQISELQNKNNSTDQSLTEVQQARQKAEQAVQQTAASSTPATSNSTENQTWEAKIYNADDRVSYNGKDYIAKWYASASDIPGNVGPWQEYKEIH
ncbi:helix-rich protein [Lactococcus lactis subsp. lactis]|nr:helix-rich protein [Lactococcus lactis subsp. lactis]